MSARGYEESNPLIVKVDVTVDGLLNYKRSQCELYMYLRITANKNRKVTAGKACTMQRKQIKIRSQSLRTINRVQHA